MLIWSHVILCSCLAFVEYTFFKRSVENIVGSRGSQQKVIRGLQCQIVQNLVT